MLEQGLVSLINSNTAVQEICVNGGYLVELPPNQVLPSWTHTTISEPQEYLLDGTPSAPTMRRWQVDSYAQTADVCIKLSAAIANALAGFRGRLSDPDSTGICGIFADNLVDFFDSAARTYRRCADYRVFYVR